MSDKIRRKIQELDNADSKKNDKDAAGKTQSRNIGCTLDQFEDT